MKAIQLHDRFSEEIIGTILTQEHNYNLVCEKWDKYQQRFNSESNEQPDIYDFVNQNSVYEFCEVLEVDFYQPN